MASCREKRNIMMPTKEFWSKKQFTDSSSMEQWILARRNIRKFISPSLLQCSNEAGSGAKIRSRSKQDQEQKLLQDLRSS